MLQNLGARLGLISGVNPPSYGIIEFEGVAPSFGTSTFGIAPQGEGVGTVTTTLFGNNPRTFTNSFTAEPIFTFESLSDEGITSITTGTVVARDTGFSIEPLNVLGVNRLQDGTFSQQLYLIEEGKPFDLESNTGTKQLYLQKAPSLPGNIEVFKGLQLNGAETTNFEIQIGPGKPNLDLGIDRIEYSPISNPRQITPISSILANNAFDRELAEASSQARIDLKGLVRDKNLGTETDLGLVEKTPTTRGQLLSGGGQVSLMEPTMLTTPDTIAALRSNFVIPEVGQFPDTGAALRSTFVIPEVGQFPDTGAALRSTLVIPEVEQFPDTGAALRSNFVIPEVGQLRIAPVSNSASLIGIVGLGSITGATQPRQATKVGLGQLFAPTTVSRTNITSGIKTNISTKTNLTNSLANLTNIGNRTSIYNRTNTSTKTGIDLLNKMNLDLLNEMNLKIDRISITRTNQQQVTRTNVRTTPATLGFPDLGIGDLGDLGGGLQIPGFGRMVVRKRPAQQRNTSRNFKYIPDLAHASLGITAPASSEKFYTRFGLSRPIIRGRKR